MVCSKCQAHLRALTCVLILSVSLRTIYADGLDVGQGFKPAGRMCEEGGYCSVGTSQFWTGDIATSPKLREMLEAVSYKKEIIISSLTSADEKTVWLDPILQLHWELEEAGYGHFVVHTGEKKTCDQLHQYRKVSCIWDSTPNVRGNTNNRHGVWFARWKFFARAGRMGYNIMNIDGDIIFMRDPYVHIKRKPMSDIHMWCNFEGGGPLHCNGGFTYVQNLRPDGPVAWIFKNVVDDQVWMMDDNFEFLRRNADGMNLQDCHFFDQELIFDGVKGAFIGRPVPYDYFTSCRRDSWTIKNRFGVAMSKTAIQQNLRTIMGNDQVYRNETHVMPPPDWLPDGFKPDADMTRSLVNRLTVPNMNYGYVAELGGNLGPEPRGNYTAQWLDTLKSDCPDCPWWNDNRPLKNGKDELDVLLGPKLDGKDAKWVPELFWDKDVPTELLAVGPVWMSESINGWRTGMWAGPREPGLGHNAAIVHVHHWPGLSSWHKVVVRKITGRYNWDLGALTSINKSTPFTSGYPVSRVLMLHPSIDLGRTRSLEEYNKIVYGLMQVAQMTHRTVVFPDVPCEAPWLHAHDAYNQEGICAMPVNRLDNRWPNIWSMPYAIDPLTRQLVGGWTQVKNGARRLLASAASKLLGSRTQTMHTEEPGAQKSEQTAQQQPAGMPAGLAYVIDRKTGLPVRVPSGDRAPGADARSQHAEQGAATGWLGGRLSRLQRRLQEAAGPLYRTTTQRANFWKDKRFMYSLAWNADFECTREIGMPGGIMAHELAYWLTTPAAANATYEPVGKNTVFAPRNDLEPGLKVMPFNFPPEHGRVYRNSSEKGWSVADTQVLLPIGQVMREMSRLAHEPVVYLGHPIALVSSQVRHARGDPVDHGKHLEDLAPSVTTGAGQHRQHKTQRRLASYAEAEFWGHLGHLIGANHGSRLNLEQLNTMLQEVTNRIANSKCRARAASKVDWSYTWIDSDFPNTPLGVVTDHRIRLLKPAKLKR